MSCAFYCCHFNCRWNAFSSTIYIPSIRFVPIIGDILIGVWKVNSRNAVLLEEFLRVRGEESLKGGGQAIGGHAMAPVSYDRISICWQSINS
jgi:hypothetical protein